MRRISRLNLQAITGAALLLAAIAVPVVSQTTRSITVRTEPNASVWIDSVLFGKTDAAGKLVIRTVPSGSHTLRIRADGFKEISKPITPAQKGELSLPLSKTTDEGELAFQEAGRLASVDRDKAAAAYRRSIKLRPRYAQAYIELARVLLDAQKPFEAAKAISDLRKFSPRNAEASAVQGRIDKDLGDEEKAIVSFQRAITEGRGVQPEAYTGLGLLYKERAEGFGGEGDLENETANYDKAATYLKTALKQLSGAPDSSVLYQLLGLIYERQKKFNEAIAVYEEFLRFFPDTNDATAVRSFIVQIKKQMAAQE
jgi:tetratricopeptide (TPR) repeat protein